MRILHVIPSVATGDGGPAKAVVEMCREASRRGAEAEVYTTNLDGSGTHSAPCGTPIDIGGVRITYFPIIASNFYKVSPALAAALRNKVPTYHVVHIHSLYQFPSTVAAYYCRQFGVPYIVRPHGTLDPYLYRRHRRRKWLYEMLFERRNLRKASAVHFVSVEEMRLASESGLEFNPVVAPFGVDLEDVPVLRGREAMERTWPATTGQQVVLFFGRVNFKKGLDLLARAFGQIGRARDDVVLVIAGPDNEGFGTQVRSWLQDEGVARKVIFTGMLTGEKKKAILAGASIFVLPSYTENFGIAVVEAMAAGLPVVISKHVNIYQEVADAQAGLVVNNDESQLADAIGTLLDNPAIASGMGQKGRQLARETFSWDSAGPELMEMYARVASHA